jgi:hypothetical protein
LPLSFTSHVIEHVSWCHCRLWTYNDLCTIIDFQIV